MGWATRVMLFAAGLFMVLLARTQLRTGRLVFPNASYHQTTFAASGFGVGLIVMLAALLPPSDWVYRHITTRKLKNRFLKRRG